METESGQGLEAELVEQKYGRDVVVRNIWQRHTQKMSGEVFNVAKTGLSFSDISPGGAERARELGKTIPASRHGEKGYVSAAKRTPQTLEAMLQGYRETNPNAPIREEVRVRPELTTAGPAEHLKIYDAMWNANKAALLADRGLKLEDFSKLSADEQEQIAEAAEEPVVREWLDNPDSELARTFPPHEAASRFAVLFKRHQDIAARLNNGSRVDLLHVTHKTVTEPFLTSGVLVRKSDGQRITKLDEIGGSLRILDNWESEAKTDEAGVLNISVTLRGQEYGIDKTALDSLAAEGLEKKYGKE